MIPLRSCSFPSLYTPEENTLNFGTGPFLYPLPSKKKKVGKNARRGSKRKRTIFCE